jgi:quercetin dioxygenase-like cupin family protein
MSDVTRLQPTVVSAHGTPPKQISEFVGLASTGEDDLSLALMRSPAGWSEPAQVTQFAETTVVIEGAVVLHLDSGEALTVPAGEAITVPPGIGVRYETPERAVYVSLCRPAFSPARLVREPGA